MKHCIKLFSTLAVLGLPIAAEAKCDRYPNSTLTLHLPAVIQVPDSVPIGGVIAERLLSGSAPAFLANCTAVRRWQTGRYPNIKYPGTGAYHTEVPGVGLRLEMTWADGTNSAFFAIYSTSGWTFGRVPSFTSARAVFYKMGPITDGTVRAGNFLKMKWATTTETFSLDFGNSIRFVGITPTCDLAAGDVNRTINLPPIQASALKDIVYAGVHNFELTANCSNAANVTFRITGTPAQGNPLLFANTGTAGGVDLWMYSRIGGVTQNLSHNQTRTVAVSGGSAVLPLGVAYHRNGTVKQGTLVTTATVNITYN